MTTPSRSLLRRVTGTVLLRSMRRPSKSWRFFLSLAVLASIPAVWAIDCIRIGEPMAAGENDSTVPSPTVMQTGQSSSHPDSGIYGHMIAAWGNPPAQPPTYECVRVIDTVRQIVVAKGICSGLRGEFHVPLEPGKYMVEAGGKWETTAGVMRFVPHHQTVEIKAGEWVEIAPPTPPAPVP